eukprot:597499-Alexandrium_andersonii.AAC.1
MAQAAAGLASCVDKRFLPHMTPAELYDMYLLFGDLDVNATTVKAKRKCVDRVFKKDWGPSWPS